MDVMPVTSGFEIVENINEVFFVVSLDAGSVFYISPAFERVWGASRDSLYKNPRSWMDAVVEEDRDRVRESLSHNPFGEMKYRIRRPDGAERWISARTFPVRDGAGKVVRMAGVAEDVTERVRAEEDLRMEKERYRVLLENAPEAILVLDCDTGRYVDFNQSAAQFFGVPGKGLLDKCLADLSPVQQPDGRPSRRTAQELVAAALDGAKPVFDWVCRTADGRGAACEVRLVRLPDKDRRLVRASINDISQRKALEEQFHQAQKMEAVGRLAGGVAHDFNNLLTVIMGFSQILERRIPKDDPDRSDLNEIIHASERAAALSRQLLVFSRKHAVQPQLVNLNETVDQMQKLFRRVIGEDINLGSCLRPDLGSVRADPGQIEQVLMNLVVNARDAMPQGGKLTLETRNVELSDDAAWKFKGLANGRYVMLAVSDTGIGMTEDVRARIFEPFFTTKEPGKGTGLGLSTVYEIVRQSGGHISVYSEVGKGSSFKIYLPYAAGIAPSVLAAAKAEPAGGTETVLLVEDEKEVCDLVDLVLRGKGYRTLTATSPAQALALAEKHVGPAPLLVTDVVMPEMSGPELAQKLKAKWPDLKVLYISGYTEGHLHDEDLLKAGTGLLHKPFAPMVLAREVRGMLDAQAA